MSAYPFALKSKRFVWQTDKFQNSGVEIKGDLTKYKHLDNSRLTWEGMNNISEANFPTFKSKEELEKKMKRRLTENSKSIRTVMPTKVFLNVIF
jgi:hypothetical protein